MKVEENKGVSFKDIDEEQNQYSIAIKEKVELSYKDHQQSKE